MSATPWKGEKLATGVCDCGNLSHHKKGNYWVCDRCDRIEKAQRMDCKSHTAGFKPRLHNSTKDHEVIA